MFDHCDASEYEITSASSDDKFFQSRALANHMPASFCTSDPYAFPIYRPGQFRVKREGFQSFTPGLPKNGHRSPHPNGD
jgi:hypothetical protein